MNMKEFFGKWQGSETELLVGSSSLSTVFTLRHLLLSEKSVRVVTGSIHELLDYDYSYIDSKFEEDFNRWKKLI